MERYVDFTKISNKGFDRERTGQPYPMPDLSQIDLAMTASSGAMVPTASKGGLKSGDFSSKTGTTDLQAMQSLIKKWGLGSNGSQDAWKALSSGWSSGGIGGVASALFGGGATSLLGPIAGGIGSMVSGYMNMRKQARADKVAQQNADANTLIAGKSSGGFRWDDPGNTPDKYLDGTVTKGNFFNPGGLLGKRTV
tara:strand:- start:1393 stop:1977 length:585 start_codon:yes stop_codon:yes gene_type:complete